MLMELGERLAVLEGEWNALDRMCRGGGDIADDVGAAFCDRLYRLTDSILACTATSTAELAVQVLAIRLVAGENAHERAFIDAVARFVEAAGGVIHPPG
jgi:hypothetical protein